MVWNRMKFYKDEVKVLHLGRNNLLHKKNQSGEHWQGSHSVEGGIWIIVDHKLNMCQQFHTLAKKGKS